MHEERSAPAGRKLVPTATPGIYKRGGSYVLRYRDPKGRVRQRSAHTLKEARALRSALVADVSRGEHRELSRVTFADYAEEWAAHYQGRTGQGIRAATRADYAKAIGDVAVPFFGRRRLAEIEPRDIKAYARHLAEGGRKPATVRNLIAPLRALFATALEEGAIRHNPCLGLRLAAGRPATHEEGVKALTDDELGRLLAEATPGLPRLMIRFLADTGLRVGEAIALTWADIDFGTRRVKVRRRLYRGDEDAPKSRYGRRDVPVSESLCLELWAHRKGSSFAKDSDPVFATSAGTPQDRAHVYSRIVKPAARRAEVPWCGVHSLRHTCATRLFRAGLNAKQVQVWLGHHSPAFTLDRYVHLLPDDLPTPSFLDSVPNAAGGHSGGHSEEPKTADAEAIAANAKTAD